MTDFGREAAAGVGAELLAAGGVFVPQFLLSTYRALGLSDAEFMLLLQIAGFRQAEGNAFPTPDEIGARMGIGEGKAAELIGGLIRRGFLAIDERIDPETGVRSEAYRWTGWYERAASMHASAAASARGAGPAAAGAEPDRRTAALEAGLKDGGPASDLFAVFEREFGRPLSPMELETISAWLDQDRYPEELIRFALKEAVFAGKMNFRYIDRILLEWSRNRITSAEEARLHARQFRGRTQR
jgi:DnaD and phage-associated domain